MKRNLRLFIYDIMEEIRNIEAFSENLSKEGFTKSKLRQHAIFRSMEIIGEASKNIPNSFRERYKDVPWKEIAGFRDIVIHEYFGIDVDIVWHIVKKDIPSLKKKIKKIKKDLEKTSETI